MYSGELGIKDRLEDILESINLIEEWSKGMTELHDFMISPSHVMAFNACVMKLQVIGEHVGKLLKEDSKPLDDYKEIKFDGKRVILCHYPMPFYRSDYSDMTYMLYGHVHNNFEEQQLIELRKHLKSVDDRGVSRNRCQFYNAWLGYYNYAPATLEQILNYWSEK